MSTELEFLFRVVVAAVLAGLVGWDRESRNRPAGIRTHMLVAAGAALFVAASYLITSRDATLAGGKADVVRIPAAIVTGVGFLGAGAILRSGERVTGLTTAAGIWVCAAIGVLIGSGFWVIGCGATVIVLIIVNITGLVAARTRTSDDETSPPPEGAS